MFLIKSTDQIQAIHKLMYFASTYRIKLITLFHDILKRLYFTNISPKIIRHLILMHTVQLKKKKPPIPELLSPEKAAFNKLNICQSGL